MNNKLIKTYADMIQRIFPLVNRALAEHLAEKFITQLDAHGDNAEKTENREGDIKIVIGSWLSWDRYKNDNWKTDLRTTQNHSPTKEIGKSEKTCNAPHSLFSAIESLLKLNQMRKVKAKRTWLLVVVLCVGASGIYLYFDIRDFLGFTTLSLTTAEKAWGTKEFNPERFKNGSTRERAAQTASLIRSHRYIGKELKTVISELGSHDGYYNSDEIPDYSLGDLKGTHWELVFLPDENGRVNRIIIHKECCYHGIFNLFIR